MGGKASKNADFRSSVEKYVNQTFEQNCTTNGTCSQSLALGNINVNASGNCRITFENICKFDMDAQCNMTNAIDKLVPNIQNQDPKFIDELGKLLKDKNGNALFDRANIQHKSLTTITNAFKQSCATNTGSYQNIKSGDLDITCNDNSTFEMRNKSNHSANCITNMLNTAIDNIPETSKTEESNKNESPDTSNFVEPNKGFDSVDVAIMCVASIIIVLVLRKLFTKNTQNNFSYPPKGYVSLPNYTY